VTRKTSTLLVVTGLLAACTGTITDPPGVETDGPGSSPLSCDGAAKVGASPLRRLTRLEYDNTVRDLLGDESRPAQAFVSDEAVAGFDANSVAAVSKQETEDFLDAAAVLAKTAVANGFVTCDPTQDSCGASVIESFGRRAFRRPLSSDEKSDFSALYASAKQEWGATIAIELVIRTILSSPSFLYLVENSAAGTGTLAVDANTLATRLSYFLWGSMPDDELFAAADAGKLGTLDDIDAQARRMLADPRAKGAVESFHVQWLGITGLEEATKDPELFPSYDADLAASMEAETRRFAASVVLEGDARLATLLTADHSFVDGALAALYGVPAPSQPFQKTQLDPQERAGVLTHASVMAAHSGASQTSWVHRGKLVRERFLCDTIPPPPPGVESTDPKNLGRLENPSCKGCHLKMDPIGFGFDAYSPIGGFRTVDETGKPVEQKGAIHGDGESSEFEGAVELAHQLAAREDVGRCVAVQWFRYATRRQETDADACSIAFAQKQFAESGGDIRELMIAITKTDAFRHRAVSQ
jgi:hypothetical protein